MLISTLGKYVVSVTIVRTSRVGPAVCNTKKRRKTCATSNMDTQTTAKKWTKRNVKFWFHTPLILGLSRP